MQPDMFNGWGIRTLSADAAAYHPIGYHLGTVWPHDNSFILDGFRRYGHDDAAERLFLGLLEAGRRLPEGRLPECFAGFDRDRFRVPVRYPVACHPQAWAAGALPAGLLSLLGLEPAGFDRSLIVRRPRLPAGIEELEIRGIPIADATVHLRFCRSSDATDVEVVAVDGEVDVKLESDVPPHRATSGE
jgi:glycogen debranching enzyme